MKQNTPKVNKLKYPPIEGELDLCADIQKQRKAFMQYVNDHCVNCNSQPCRCHLIPTI